MQAIPPHVEGLDRALGGGIPEGNIVLIAGGPGTMKSPLVYSILHGNAQNGIPGLFVSLEQDAQDVVEKMALLGMEPLPEDRLYVMDMTHLRLALRDKGNGQDLMERLSTAAAARRHGGGWMRCVPPRHDRGCLLLDWVGGKFAATKALQQ